MAAKRDFPVTLYHNPRCSKSREALALLTEKGITPVVVLYLENPPDEKTIRSILKKAKLKAPDIIRKGEAEYKTLRSDAPPNDPQWLAALVKHPILLERPIAVCGEKAAVGRPPEKILEVLP